MQGFTTNLKVKISFKTKCVGCYKTKPGKGMKRQINLDLTKCHCRLELLSYLSCLHIPLIRFYGASGLYFS